MFRSIIRFWLINNGICNRLVTDYLKHLIFEASFCYIWLLNPLWLFAGLKKKLIILLTVRMFFCNWIFCCQFIKLHVGNAGLRSYSRNRLYLNFFFFFLKREKAVVFYVPDVSLLIAWFFGRIKLIVFLILILIIYYFLRRRWGRWVIREI